MQSENNFIRMMPPAVVAAFALGVVIFATLAFTLLFLIGWHEGNRFIMKAAAWGVGFAYVSQLFGALAEFWIYQHEFAKLRDDGTAPLAEYPMPCRILHVLATVFMVASAAVWVASIMLV